MEVTVILLMIVLLLLFMGMIGCIYLFIRNERVCLFRMIINNLTGNMLINYLEYIGNDENLNNHRTEYEFLSKSADNLHNKYSYDKMLFSFKPLEFDKWFSVDELAFLDQYKQFMPDRKILIDKVVKSFNKH